jgi:hypothetical protein
MINNIFLIFIIFAVLHRLSQWVVKTKIRVIVYCLISIILFLLIAISIRYNCDIFRHFLAPISYMINLSILTILFCILKKILKIKIYEKYPIIFYGNRATVNWEGKGIYKLTIFEYIYSLLLIIGAFILYRFLYYTLVGTKFSYL